MLKKESVIEQLLDVVYSLEEGTPSEEIKHKDENLLSYLWDAGVEPYMIANYALKVTTTNELSYNRLPEMLWEKSLLKRDTFYFHKELEILSPPSTWDEDKPFYLEMKIEYRINEALDYFLKSNKVREEWINRKKELGSLKFLLKEFEKYKFAEPIDFFLHLCDFAASKAEKNLQSIFDLNHYEVECAEYLEADIANARLQGKDKVIWRG